MILPVERRQALTARANAYASQVDKAMPYLLDRGISKPVAEMFNLGYGLRDENDYEARLTIPYVTPAGVVHIKYRCVNPSHHDGDKHAHADCPKYLYEAGGTQHHLYNAQVLIHSADTVVLTEGELDAVCVQAYCGLPAVAFPGVDSWTAHPHWALCFEGVSEVIVVADGDEQGRKAAQRVAKSIGMAARIVEMPIGFDSNKYIAGQGAQAFIERLA